LHASLALYMRQKTPPFDSKATQGHYRLVMRVLILPSAASLSFTVLLDFALFGV